MDTLCCLRTRNLQTVANLKFMPLYSSIAAIPNFDMLCWQNKISHTCKISAKHANYARAVELDPCVTADAEGFGCTTFA